jgi:4-diphosphocytidyl-2-C-methyl-D-erythritol kinase
LVESTAREGAEIIGIVARAKVNLSLHIKGVGSSGYHEVETVLQSITLHDELFIQPSRATRVHVEWATGVAGSLPGQPDIVEKTIGIAQEILEGLPNVSVRIVKKIPIGAGLGGASADAAATIRGLLALNRRTAPPGVIADIASRIGVDVAFCLAGGTALGTGRGDVLRNLPYAGTLWWVVGVPSSPLETRAVYKHFDEIGATGTNTAENLVAALASGDLGDIATALVNDLETAAFDLLPELDGLKREMVQAGALGSVMTGSGSAIIGLCRDSSHARAVAQGVRRSFSRVEIVSSARTGSEMMRPHSTPSGAGLVWR